MASCLTRASELCRSLAWFCLQAHEPCSHPGGGSTWRPCTAERGAGGTTVQRNGRDSDRGGFQCVDAAARPDHQSRAAAKSPPASWISVSSDWTERVLCPRITTALIR